jgi:hypothetical protein
VRHTRTDDCRECPEAVSLDAPAQTLKAAGPEAQIETGWLSQKN